MAAGSTWNVFVAYRHDDGGAAAEWLYRNLHQRPVEDAAPAAPRLLLYYDQIAPAVSDWRSVHGRRLGRAAAFILVCSPGAAHEREGERDELYEEIRWWMRRRSTAPILVETVGRSGAWVPAPVQKRWPDAQRLRVETDTWVDERGGPTAGELRVRDRILDGIRWSQRRVMDDELTVRRRRQRVLTGLLGALLVLFGLAVAATTYGCQQRRRAEERAVQAERSRARTLMRQGLDLCETGRTDLGLLYLAEARRTAPESSHDLCRVLDTQLARGVTALNRLEVQRPVGLPIRRLVWSSAGTRVAVGATAEGRTRVVVRDLADGGGTWTRSYDRGLEALCFTPDGTHVVAGLQGGGVYVSKSDAEQAGTALGIDGETSAIAVSADGLLLATGTQSGDVHVRPLSSDDGGIRLAGGSRGRVLGLSFVPPSERTGLVGKGPELIVAYAGGGPLLWGTSSQRHRPLEEGLTGEYDQAVFASNPLRLAVAGKHRLRHVVQCFALRADDVQHVAIHPPTGVTSLALEPGPKGGRCLTGTDDWHVRCYAPDGHLLRSFRHGYAITDVCFIPDTPWIGTASQDLTAAIWDVSTGLRVGSPLRHPRSPTAIRAFSSGDRTYVVTGCWDGVLRRWALPRPEHTGRPLLHDATGVDVAFVPGVGRAVTGGADGRVVEWDLESGRLHRELLRSGNAERIRCVASGPGGDDVIAGGYAGTVRVWRRRAPGEHTWVDPIFETIHDVDVSADGRWAASGNAGGKAVRWDLETGEVRPLAPSRGIEGAVSVVRFSPQGRYLVVGGEDDLVRVFDPETCEEVVPLVDHGGNVLHVAISPDERHLATAGYGKHAVVWDLETGSEIHRLGPHEDHVDHVAFDESGRFVVTASYDHTARLWQLGDEATRVAVLRHPGRVGVARFAPAGSTVFTGCADGFVREWDVETGVLLHTLSYGGEVRVLEVRDADSGRELLAGGGASYARFWWLPPAPEHEIGAAGPTPDAVERATGLYLDDDGAVRVLTPEAWGARAGR